MEKKQMKIKNSEIIEKYKDLNKKDYRLLLYTDENGDLDYDRYVEKQTIINKRKLHLNGPSDVLVRQLSYFVSLEFKLINHKPQKGLCHGTRNGSEQRNFSKYLGIPVLGTDISETAPMFPNTIQWDFHHIKDEWVNNIDFIYSNSLDHSYDPIHCLRQWFKCLKPGGICILAHDREADGNLKNNTGLQEAGLDPNSNDGFQGSFHFYEKIIKIAGEMDGITGLKYVLNTEYMLPQVTMWNMEASNWGMWDYHFVIQKITDKKREELKKTIIQS